MNSSEVKNTQHKHQTITVDLIDLKQTLQYILD